MAASVVLSLATVWALTGCRPDLARETAAVESMFPVLGNILMRLSQTDTIAPNEVTERLRLQCGRIRPDSITDSVLAADMGEVCLLPDRISQLLERRRKLIAEARNTEKQLRDLHTDLTLGIADRDSAAAFIETEFLYVEHLGELGDELEEAIARCIILDRRNRPAMDSLMTVATEAFVK